MIFLNSDASNYYASVRKKAAAGLVRRTSFRRRDVNLRQLSAYGHPVKIFAKLGDMEMIKLKKAAGFDCKGTSRDSRRYTSS